MRNTLHLLTVLLLAAPVVGGASIPTPVAAPLPDEARLRALTARFAPVEIKVDTSALPANERLSLAKMVEAAKIIDALFLRQVAPLNETYLNQLVRDTSPLGRARLHYFSLNAGPWSRPDAQAAFLPGVGAKPPGANF